MKTASPRGLAGGCFPETGRGAWLGGASRRRGGWPGWGCIHSHAAERVGAGFPDATWRAAHPGFCVAHALASRGATAPPASGPPLGDAWSCYPRPICSWTAKAASDSIPCWSRVYTLSSHRKGSGRVVPALVRDLLQSTSQVKKKKKARAGDVDAALCRGRFLGHPALN